MTEFTSFDDADVAAGDGATHAPEVEASEPVRIVPADGTLSETAQALLDAAESLELDPRVIEYSDGNFYVPQEVADAADLPEAPAETDEPAAAEADGSTPAPAKKAPAKRAPSRARTTK